MVRLYRTFSNLIFTVGTRCVGYLYTVSEWFNPLESPRTFSNHFSAEKVRCVEVFDVSSEWFDCTEPSPAHAPRLVPCELSPGPRGETPRRPQRTLQDPSGRAVCVCVCVSVPNLLEPLQCRESEVCRSLCTCTNLVTSTCPVSTLYFNISIDFLIEMKVASHELS